MTVRERGLVKWFNRDKGFGFIKRENGDDIFVHFRAISNLGYRILSAGQLVEFFVIQAQKGLQADSVAIVE